MSVNSEQAQGLVLINGHAYPVKEVLRALERQAMTTLRVVGEELWVGNERIRPFSKTSAEQAMMLTCYGSLAFCCSLSRKCSLRDEAIRLLGMSEEEYQAIQQECHQRFVRFSERRWPHDIVITPGTESSPSSSPSFSEPQRFTEGQPTWSSQRTYSQRYSPSGKKGPASIQTIDLGGLFEGTTLDSSRNPNYREPHQKSTMQASLEPRGVDHSMWFSSSDVGNAVASQRASTSYGFCIFCGSDLSAESEFCNRCGRSQK